MDARQKIISILDQLNTVLVGKSAQVQDCVACLLAGGHLLIEDLPGVGKTTLAHALANLLGLSFSRIQFTSDLLPADITGVSVYERQSGEFRFLPGPVFAQMVLADEINRATPKTQSALLEAMEERQVTVAGTTHPLPEIFLVMATQNPIEQEGTYPLPEAQVDRFMLKVVINYPSKSEEQLIVRQNTLGLVAPVINPVASTSEILTAKELVRQVYLDEKVENYILDIVFATRFPEKYNLPKLKPLIGFGGSPRASINLALAAKAYAFLNKRGYVIPEDVRSICKDVLRHRIGLTYEAEAENVNVEQIIDEILRVVNVP